MSDKHGLVDFSKGLVSLGYEILATDGTAKALRAERVPVRSVSEYTGQPEVLGGRVKTLHPKIFAAILAVEGNDTELARYGIEPVDLVVANLSRRPSRSPAWTTRRRSRTSTLGASP